MVVLEGRLAEIVASHQTVAPIDDRQLGMHGSLGRIEKYRNPAFP
jgi:hypothetical protein